MPTSKKLYLSWEDVHHDIKDLASQLKNYGPWHKIVAVTRGGLIPSAILVQYLDIRLVDTVCIATYTSQDQQIHAELFKMIYDEATEILVVDDLVDTGKTFELIRESLPNATYVSVYYKPAGYAQIDFGAKPIPQDVWVVFPWEEA